MPPRRKQKKWMPSEPDWLFETDPQALWVYTEWSGTRAIIGVSDRRARLLAVAIVRAVWAWEDLPPGESEAVKVAERYADGKATTRELMFAYNWTEPVCHVTWSQAPQAVRWMLGSPVVEASRRCVELLLRDVLGNPFRPVMTLKAAVSDVLSKERLKWAAHYHKWTWVEKERQILRPEILAWEDSKAIKLAEHIYETRDFDAMPILGDALEEAGVINQDVLAHCRGPGPHCRGCWLLDVLLGKE